MNDIEKFEFDHLGAERSRFTSEDIENWRVNGAILLPSFFSISEIAPIAEDFERIFTEDRKVGMEPSSDRGEREPHILSDEAQHLTQHFEYMPMGGYPGLNLFPLHPSVIEFAKAALAQDVRLDYAHIWLKFAGGTSFDQDFHMDSPFPVASEQLEFRTVNFLIYVSEVSDARGAIHYVSRPDSDQICGALGSDTAGPAEQKALRSVERSGAGPCGSLFAYSNDVYHRGTRLAEEKGYRYTVHAGFRAASYDARNDWQSPSHWTRRGAWESLFEQATSEQLACLSVPRPGHRFWTELTIARAQSKWPKWNLDSWRRALKA